MPRKKEEPFLDEALMWVEPGAHRASGCANSPVGTTVGELRRSVQGECERRGHEIVPVSEYSITHGSVSRWACKHCRTRWKSLSVVPTQVTTGLLRKKTHTELRVAFVGEYQRVENGSLPPVTVATL